MKVTTGGLTFLQMKPGEASVTVWAGEPVESPLVATAVLDGMLMGPEGPAALVEVLTEEHFLAWAEDWLDQNPQYRPLTDDQVASRKQLEEIVTDLLSDRELVRAYEDSVGNAEAVQKFVILAANQIRNVAAAHVTRGMHPGRATETAIVEALMGCMIAGFVTGKTFQQRGYTL